MKEKQTKSTNTKKEICSFLIVILLALICRMFVAENFFVPTGSMKHTILEGDYLFSTKYSYGYSKHSLIFSPNFFSGRVFESKPHRGDVIIFRPPHNMNTRFVKRLVGMPGDTIEIIDDVIHINQEPILRENLNSIVMSNERAYFKYKEILPNGISYYTYKVKKDIFDLADTSNFGPYYVPEGQYFFLGDNRDESDDSRYHLGFVPFENFIAKSRFIIFSTEQIFWIDNISFLERIKRISSWWNSIRWNRAFSSKMCINCIPNEK